MTKFYTAAATEISHVDGINIVKDFVKTLKQMMQNSLMIIDQRFLRTGSCFGQCSQVEKLPSYLRFPVMMTSCLQAVVDALQRQYAEYFTLDVDEKLRKETVLVRLHNMEWEEMHRITRCACKP